MTGWQMAARSGAVFLGAGLLEIAGGYGVWLWLRDGRTVAFALGGAALLVGFGLVMTLLPAHFGRAYAAYGGVFIVLSLLWGWGVDGRAPDRWDTLGALIVLAGVAVILLMPRR